MSATDEARVNFRTPASSGGFIDAAWWPRSNDLLAELPALLEPLWARGHSTNRVSFNIDAWRPVAARATIGSRVVRLGGFRYADPMVVGLSDGQYERIDVLVIAPDTDPAIAARALERAGTAGTSERAEQMMQQAH